LFNVLNILALIYKPFTTDFKKLDCLIYYFFILLHAIRVVMKYLALLYNCNWNNCVPT